MTDFQALVNRINKDMKDNVLFIGDQWQQPEITRISTGSLYLDWATNGGIPMARLTEIFGNESVGKSALAAKIISEAQRKKMTCVWIDAENSYDPKWMEKLGIDVSQLIVSQLGESESGFDLLFKLVSLGSPRSPEYKGIEPIDLIVADSLAAFAPMAVTDHDMQSHMAVDARVNNLGFKRINARNRHAAVVIINQNRSSIGGPRPTDFQPGGRGLKYYASMRLEVRGGEWIKPVDVPDYMNIETNPRAKDDPVGHNIRFRVRKCKVGGPHGKEANFDFYYNGRVDKIKDIITAGKITGVIDQGGAYFKYGEQSFHGAKAFADFLKSDKVALREIRKQVLEAL